MIETLAADLAIKATLVYLLALVADRLLRKRWILVRSAMWNACLVALLLLPLATATFPRLRIRCLPPDQAPAAAEAPDEPVPVTDAAPPAPPAESTFNRIAVLYEQAILRTAQERRSASNRAPEPIRRTPASPKDLASGSEHPAAAPIPVAQERSTASPASPPPSDEAPIPTADQQTPAPWSWPTILLAIYFAGLALLAIRLVGSLIAVARLRTSAHAMTDPAWADAADRWRHRLGIKRPVALAVSHRVSVPILIGWLRPMILLPETLTDRQGDPHRDAILVHELAHVRRHDYVWQLILRTVQVLYWPHPLTWLTGRLVIATREQACDQLCVHALADPLRYRATLLDVAAGLVRRPRHRPAWVGAPMARTPRLASRLRGIERTTGIARCLPRLPVRACIIALALAAIGVIGPIELARRSAEAKQPARETATSQPATASAATSDPAVATAPTATRPAPVPLQPTTQSTWRPGRTINISVVQAETGKPLPDVPLEIYFGKDNEYTAKTDRQGWCLVKLPDKEPYWATITATPKGMVHRQAHFRGYSRRFDIPEQYTLRLTPGTVIGGIVQDPAGKPIKGASVCIDMSCADEMDHVHIHDQVAKTDADGKWQCDVIPPDASEVRLSVTHPNYVARDRDYGASPPPIEQLRDKTYTVTLAKGIVIQGTVTDLDGKPIEGALIILGQELPDELPQTKTDAKGQYRLACAAAGVNFVTVYAKGHVPDQKRLVAAADIPPVDFRLGPPYIIHGRVLDPQGRPLKGARVSPNRWRGLWINEFHFDTDDQGRFRWDNAPPDTIAFYVAKKGYQTLPNYPLSPSTADHVIRLQPTPIVKGAVVDAETGRPIPKFKVLLSDEDSDRTTWKTDKTFGTGRYEVAFDDLQKRYRVRIEAEGYKPAISQDIPPGASEHTCNFRLVKSDLTVAAATSPTTTQPSAATAQPPIPPAEALGTIVRSLFGRSPAKNRRRKVSVEGVITDSDAHPIPKAEVFLCQRVIGSKLLKTTTDAQGKFQMDQARLGEGILAAHAPGYAPSQGKIRLTKDKLTIQMRLAPGELLQGRVVDNNQRPLNAARLTATNWGDVELTGLDTSLDLDLKTDADGRFRYDHAPPEGVVYTICKEGYQSAEDLHLKPSPSPHLIALHPAAIVHGSVTDAKTGKAVWECQIEQGLVRQDGKIDWSARDETFTEGRYKIHFDGQAHAYRFRVSADGYRPAVSPSFSPGQLDAIHDVKLEPTDDLRGSVLLPDGKPLAGGIVTLLMPSQYSFVIDGKPLHLPDLPLRTRGDGSFTLHPQAEPFGLLVVDERGWAEVPSDQFAANPEIRLQPWARVEGIYRVGGKPVSDVKLGLRWREPDRKRLPEVDYTYNARTDANGRFVFQRVRPGTIKIAEDWRSGEGELPSGYDVTVTVKPGETKQVNIGGPGDAPMGRLVIGRIVPPPGSARDIDWNQDQSAYLYRSDDDLDESLLSLALKSPLKRLPKLRTDREVDPSRPESYHFRITPDGSFRIDDVVHGSYRMHVTVKKDAPDGWDEMRGELEHSFTVSAAFRDARNKPTDLGELVITLYNTPQPGDQAPLIEIPPSHEQLPGRRGARKTFRLADYVGPKSARKVVLLTFWTNPFRPRPWLDAFKAIHDAFAGDDRLVMVVILEPKRDRGEAKDFWSKDLAEAIRVPVGAYEAKSTLNAYGLPGMIGQQPRVFLIATDGTVLAANLHPNAIKPAIATALSSTRKSASTSAPTPTATQPAARERKANDVQQAALDFRAVQRPDGSPLPGVSLRIAGANVATAETNAKGKCTIPLPENRAISLFITADKPGFVPVQVVWSNGDDSAKKEHAYTLAMEPGKPFGGIVVDDANRPIDGALVTVNLRRDAPEAGSGAKIKIWDQLVRTDAKGRWRFELAPDQLDGLALRITAPGFIDVELAGATLPPPGQLRDMTPKVSLQPKGKGVPVLGRVLDQHDRPIVGATVAASIPFLSRSAVEVLLTSPRRDEPVKTDADGRFCLYAQNNRQLDVTVRAPGLASLGRRINVQPDMEPLTFRLQPGRLIQARVVDSKGKPLSNVNVTVKSALTGIQLNSGAFLHTDHQGRFEWRAAPDDRLVVQVWEPRHKRIERPLDPSDQPHTITLYRQTHVSGTVTDALTGKPIDKFDVVPHGDAVLPGLTKIAWKMQDAVKTSPGRYEIKPQFNVPGADNVQFRIEAKGYQPFSSPKLTEKDEDVTCDVKLHPAQYLTGQVLTPDGKPAADALLVMSRYPFPIILKNRRVEDSLDLYRQIHADKDGQFRFADPAEPTPLLVLHDKGWAMRSTKQPKTLVSVALQPWAGVQGTLTIARRPLPNQNIVVLATVGGTDLPLVTHQVTAKTDAQGRFALDHVLPGPAEIGQQMSLPRDAKLGLAAISPHKLLTRRRYIEPQPGKTTTVDLGGLGRTVAGAVKLPPADPGDPTVTWPPAANLISTCQSPPPMPEAVRNASAVKRQAWLDEWYKTPAGRAHRQAFRAFAAPVRPDGTFEVQAVPAGSYSLTLCACRKTSNKFLEGLPGMSSPKVVGWTRHDFEVPDTSPADEGSPMDLGQLTLKAPTPIRPGRPAPPIEFETPGGKPHRLADYRGKFVVLHLWWGSESIGTLNVDLSPFADDNRLAFLEIGVCDFASPEAQLYAKLSQTYSPFAPFGHFGLLDEDAGLQVASDLGLPPIKGLQSIATTLLIDPNGNVIASDLAPDQIAPAIAKALGTPQDQPKDAD